MKGKMNGASDKKMYYLIIMSRKAAPPGRSAGTRYHADVPLRCSERWIGAAHVEQGLTPQYALVYVSSGTLLYSDKHTAPLRVRAGEAFQRFPERAHRIEYGGGVRTHFVAVPAEVLSLIHI